MSELQDNQQLIADFFRTDGILAAHLPGYEYREIQPQCARLIADGVANDQHVLVEAGTGSGKSFIAIIAANVCRENDWKVVISTESNSLLEQYYTKDLPLLQGIMAEQGKHFTFAKAKGRGNFVCLDKTDSAVGEMQLAADVDEKQWTQLIEWITKTATGDREEVPFQLDWAVWSKVNCEDVCKGKGCSYNKSGKCFLQKAKEAYRNADIVVTNHTLYLLDAWIGGFLLGQHEIVVFDEAHTLVEIAQQTFGKSITSRTMSGFAQYAHGKLSRMGIWPEDKDGEWKKLEERIEKAEDLVWGTFRLVKLNGDSIALRLKDVDPNVWGMAKVHAQQLFEVMRTLDSTISQCSSSDKFQRDAMGDIYEGIKKKLKEHIHALGGIFELEGYTEDFNKDSDTWCKYIEIQKLHGGKFIRMEIHHRPVDVAPLMRKLVWERENITEDESDEYLHSAVLMSATLATGGNDFSFIRRELGLKNTLEIIVGSPFDYAEQMYGWFPLDIPDRQPLADDRRLPEYWDKVAEVFIQAITLTQGGAFALFTSLLDMREVSDRVRDKIPYTFLMQGDMPRNKLVEAFKKDVHSCGAGVKSFWTGVDIPGQALRCIFIPRLPFRVPTDPMFAAKCDLITQRGGKWFMDYSLPLAIADMRQGIGRLIRTRTDKGLLVFGDPRIFQKRYGTIVRNSFPICKVLNPLPDTLDL